jgi:hypothetical protein
MRRSFTGTGFALCLGGVLSLALINETPRKGIAKSAATRRTIPQNTSPYLAAKQLTEGGAPYLNRAVHAYAKLPLAFEPNWGQLRSEGQFLARGDGYTLSLTPTEAAFALSSPATARPGNAKSPKANASSNFLPDLARQYHNAPFRGRNQTAKLLRMKLVGANTSARFAALDPLPGHSNYFIGSDPLSWRTNIPNYRRVKAEDVYPGIDLLYYGSQRRLEYDFVIRPGHDPRNIELEFEGAGQLRVDANGDLVLGRKEGQLRLLKPAAYQLVDGATSSSDENSVALSKSVANTVPTKNLIASRFVVMGKNRVGFTFADYDRNKDLIIDPTLSYSTLLGGSNKDIGSGIAVDGSGNAYVAGETCSLNFPTVTPLPRGPQRECWRQL